ncbi:Hypothetical predicted protein, partial [Marmota monax]
NAGHKAHTGPPATVHKQDHQHRHHTGHLAAHHAGILVVTAPQDPQLPLLCGPPLPT